MRLAPPLSTRLIRGSLLSRDETALAGHHADADDGATAQHGLLAVVVVQPQARQGGQLQEGRAGVDQAGHAFTRQQLLALLELVSLGGRAFADQGLQRAHLIEPGLHARHVGAEGFGAGDQGRTQGRHRQRFR
jgi:hypothetical protein